MLKTDWHNENREELNGIAIEQTDALRGLERVNSITELRKVVKGNILKINRKNMSYDGIMFKRNPSTPHVTFQYNTNYQQMIINHEHHRQDKPVHDRQVLRCLTHKEIDISEGRQLGKCENEHMGNQYTKQIEANKTGIQVLRSNSNSSLKSQIDKRQKLSVMSKRPLLRKITDFNKMINDYKYNTRQIVYKRLSHIPTTMLNYPIKPKIRLGMKISERIY